MPKSTWKPAEKDWGTLAHRETTQAFPEKALSRAVALCAWCYARDADTSAGDIEALAQRDAEIPRAANGKKIGDQARRQARQILGLAAKRRSTPRKGKDANLSPIEKAILARFQESMGLVSRYVELADELAKAQEAFDAARAELREISADQAQTLADADPSAAQVLADEGILSGADSTSAFDAGGGHWSSSRPDRGPADSWPRIAN